MTWACDIWDLKIIGESIILTAGKGLAGIMVWKQPIKELLRKTKQLSAGIGIAPSDIVIMKMMVKNWVKVQISIPTMPKGLLPLMPVQHFQD